MKNLPWTLIFLAVIGISAGLTIVMGYGHAWGVLDAIEADLKAKAILSTPQLLAAEIKVAIWQAALALGTLLFVIHTVNIHREINRRMKP